MASDSMNNPLSDLESMVSAALANQQEPTAENIRELIGNLRQLPMFGSIADDDAERLAKRLEERVSITQHLGSILIERDHTPLVGRCQGADRPVLLEALSPAPHSGWLSHRGDQHFG